MKVYIIEKDCSSAMGGLNEEWVFDKIFSSQQKALDYFYAHGYDSEQFTCNVIYFDDTDDLYDEWYVENGYIMRMELQDKEGCVGYKPYYLREIEVE